MQSLKYVAVLLCLTAFEGRAQRMPEIIALINSSIESGQDFQCDDSGWVKYKKINYVGSDYKSLLFFEFDLNDVNIIYAHDHYVFLENHSKYWIYVSHYYTDQKGYSQRLESALEKDILTSAAITIDLRSGVEPEPIIDALKLLRDY